MCHCRCCGHVEIVVCGGGRVEMEEVAVWTRRDGGGSGRVNGTRWW